MSYVWGHTYRSYQQVFRRVTRHATVDFVARMSGEFVKLHLPPQASMLTPFRYICYRYDRRRGRCGVETKAPQASTAYNSGPAGLCGPLPECRPTAVATARPKDAAGLSHLFGALSAIRAALGGSQSAGASPLLRCWDASVSAPAQQGRRRPLTSASRQGGQRGIPGFADDTEREAAAPGPARGAAEDGIPVCPPAPPPTDGPRKRPCCTGTTFTVTHIDPCGEPRLSDGQLLLPPSERRQQ